MMTNVLLQASTLPSKKPHFFLDIGEVHSAVIILAVVAGGRRIHTATARRGRVCSFTGRSYAVICSAGKYTTSFWNLTLSRQISTP